MLTEGVCRGWVKNKNTKSWVIADTALEEFLSDPFAVEATQLRSALTHIHTHGALLTSLILSHKALH